MPAVAWSDLLTALALYVVIEGLILFASPGAFKRMMARFLDLGDLELRRNGFIAVVLGIAMLMWVRS